VEDELTNLIIFEYPECFVQNVEIISKADNRTWGLCLSWVSFSLQNSLLYSLSHPFQLWILTYGVPQL